MTLTYEEAVEENPEISRDKAMLECRKHNVSFAELAGELGDHQTYQARDVLIWLGY